MKFKFPGLLVVGFVAGSMTVHASVIDFEALASAGSGWTTVFPPFTEDGYQLSASNGNFTSAQSGNIAWYAGSTGLFNNYLGATTTLSSTAGVPFDLVSIDLARLSTERASGAAVTFVGGQTGGGSASQTFTVGDALAFQSFSFSSDFRDLLFVTWMQTVPEHQFDNININVSAVPIPSTAWLFGTTLAGLGLARKHKQRKMLSA